MTTSLNDMKSIDGVSNTGFARQVVLDGQQYIIYDIGQAAKEYGFAVKRLPYSLRILLENVIRNGGIKEISYFKQWLEDKTSQSKIDYMPTRVLMQDFTGIPAIIDLASMREAIKASGGDPLKVNPLIPVDLVIDHSIQVDSYGQSNSFTQNVNKEMERNRERYEFLKWGQKSFENFRVVPPGTGICHQVNIEYLAQVVSVKQKGTKKYAYPDTIVGTDSHTTMVNALAVLGWGVGGIEAEAAMLGQPLPMILPEVVGVRIVGKLSKGVTATDLVLTVTHLLRKIGVVGKFVEFFGSGLANLSLADRATIANMAPEYGATCGFYPIDHETIEYLHLTGRKLHHIKMVEEYAKLQGMWHEESDQVVYTNVIEIDITSIKTSLAGPKRPQDLVNISEVSKSLISALPQMTQSNHDISKKHKVGHTTESIGHGDIVIAAITSCTNTSNPAIMITAGLVAKKANELGLTTKSWVKTSLAPGSKVVMEYLSRGGLDQHLNNLGFNLVGYGCTTCIGNTGPLRPEIDQVIKQQDIVTVAILSGNRNFEGRIHAHVKANYLASPPLVVAYALTGTINIDIENDPIGLSIQGQKAYLRDIWPSVEEVNEYLRSNVKPSMYKEKYKDVFLGDQQWQDIPVSASKTYTWKSSSTYIKNPPYCTVPNDAQLEKPLSDIKGARILAIFGDSITTDHISPAGSINPLSVAGRFLIEKGILPIDFNSYGARRGNHEVMMRGTFASPRVKNLMCNNIEGSFTINHLNGNQMSIYEAAVDYMQNAIPLVIFAGKEYGTGSSRDWAAKGTKLLGIRAVIAETFERIHRSNLVCMGVLPITFANNNNLDQLKITGREKIDILGINDSMTPYQALKCVIRREDNSSEEIDIVLQVYTENEIEYIKYGNILSTVIRNL